LYLKLDKKLILKIGNISLKPTLSDNKNLDAKKLQENFLKIPKILDFFEKIDIKQLHIKNNNFSVLLNKDKLYLDSKDINIHSKLNFVGNQMIMDIYSMYVKKLSLKFQGKSKFDVNKKIVNFFGKYKYFNLVGEINIQSTENILDFYINSSKPINSLESLKKLFRLDSVAEHWMYDNIHGKINLKYLLGKIDLNKKEAILNSIKGEAFISDAKIKFNKNAKEIYTKKLKVGYENDTLSFNFEKPIYNNKEKLYGSRAYITNLTKLKKGLIHVNLKSNSILNNNILEILKAYGINLPIIQYDGELNSTLSLSIPYLASKKMDINGEFKIKNANLKLNNFKFFSKNADIALKDNMVYIKNSSLEYKNILNAKLKLDIDTKNLIAKGEGKINNFKIVNKKREILNLNNTSLPLVIDFKNKTKIRFDSLKTTLTMDNKATNVDILSLEALYPYSNLFKELDINSGNLFLQVFNENDIEFQGDLKNLKYPLSKNKKLIKSLKINGFVKDGNTFVEDKKLDLKVIVQNKKKPLIKLKNMDISLEQSKKYNSKKLPNIDLELQNASIILDKKNMYKVKKGNIYINNSNIRFNGEVINLNLPISKNGKKIKHLDIVGNFSNDTFNIQTRNALLKLKYEVKKEKITMNLKGYDLLYDTNEKKNKEKLNIDYSIKGRSSNVIINKKYIAKSKFYDFYFNKDTTSIKLYNGKTTFFYSEDKLDNITLEAKNMNDDFLNSLINKKLIQGGEVNISASGKNRIIKGSAYIKRAIIKDLAVLNNLIILINTSPALINPLLAIPSVVNMATNNGFNLNGYRVNSGSIDFSYNLDRKFLSMSRIKTKGNGIDFDGYANIDFNSSRIDSKLKLIFFKGYSKVVGSIPVVNYILLGDKKRIDSEVSIFGSLQNPKYKTALAKEGIKAPLNFMKRIITSPIEIIQSIGKSAKDD